MITKIINLDVLDKAMTNTVYATRGDTKSIKLQFHLNAGLSPIVLNESDITVLLRAKIGASTVVGACELTDGIPTYELQSSFTDTVGIFTCELAIYKGSASDMKILYMPKFKLYIEENFEDDAEVEADDRYSGLSTLINRAESAALRAEASEAEIKAIEDIEAVTDNAREAAEQAEAAAKSVNIETEKLNEAMAKCKNAYAVAVENGFEGTEEEWLESLKGIDGKDGVGIADIIAYNVSSLDGESNTYHIVLTDGSVKSFTVKNGAKGSAGADGVGISKVSYTPSSKDDGLNALWIGLTSGENKMYSIKNGSKGSTGDKGEKGDTGEAFTYEDFTEEQLEALKGADGYTPIKGIDYFTAEDKAEVIEGLADGIICSESGRNITLKDSSNKKLALMEVFGQSSQKSYTGKNLADLSKAQGASSTPHTRFSFNNETGTVLLTSTPDTYDYVSIRVSDLNILSDKYYKFTTDIVISGLTSGQSCNVAWGLSDTRFIQCTSNGTYKVTDTALGANITSVRIFLNYGSLNPQYVSFKNIMFYEVSTAEGAETISFEPYVGGIPSPNPDYPQEILSVGDSGSVEVKTTGKNLLDDSGNKILSENSLIGRTITKSLNNKVLTFAFNHPMYLRAGRGYKIRVNAVSSVSNNALLIALIPYELTPTTADNFYITTDPRVCNKSTVQFGSTITLTPIEDGYYRLGVYVYYDSTGSISDTCTIGECQVLNGTEENEAYEPYKSNTQTITLPAPLRGIPVSSGGNVTIDGQEYISDVLRINADGSGEIERNFSEIAFTGDEAWMAGNAPSGYNYRLNISDMKSSSASTVLFIGCCSHYKRGTHDEEYGNTVDKIIANVSTTSRTIGVRDNDYTTVDDFKAMLTEKYSSGSPIKVIYQLAAPTTESLTAEQASAVLRTYKLTTNITNSEAAHMKIEYVADTKAYIDNKFAELQSLLAETQAELI